jgi:hypothetical protein
MAIQILRRRSDKGDELAYPIEALRLFEWYVNIKFLCGWKHSASHCKDQLVNTVQGSNPWCSENHTNPINGRCRVIVVYVDGMRLRLWTVATKRPVVHLPCDIWVRKATVEWYRQGKTPDYFTRYIWQLYQQSPSSEGGSGRKECWILPTKYLFHTLRVL